jgi:hypothetical protein
LIAQELEKIMPELISDSDGFKTVNYNGVIGLLVEVVKTLADRVAVIENNK